MEPMIKGYIIEVTEAFILGDPALRSRMDPVLIDQIEARAAKLNPTGWYPREDQTRLFRGMVATAPDEKSAYDLLVRSGEFSGRKAMGTFLKLVLKVLTPRMFAGKFPDFFKRDHQGGEGVVEEVGDHRVVLVARGIEGFDHFGPSTVGWAGVNLQGMGLKNVKMTCSPWSLAQPGPRETRFVATWD